MKQKVKQIALLAVMALLTVLNVQAGDHHVVVSLSDTESAKGSLTAKLIPDGEAISTAQSGQEVYIIVTSEDNRIDGSPVVRATTDAGNAQGRNRAPGILQEVEVEKVSLSQFKFTMPDYDVEISGSFIANNVITDNDVTLVWDATTASTTKVYDGTTILLDNIPLTVAIIKTDGTPGAALTKGTDYQVSYTPATQPLKGAGDYTFTITGAGSYTGTVTKTLSITKAPLTITANNIEKVYGDDLVTLTAAGSATYEGFVNNETYTVLGENLSITYADGTTAASGVGEYAINVSATSANYEITCVPGKLTVNQRPVTVSGITAEDKVYDGSATASLVLTNAAFAEGDKIGEDELTVASATGTFMSTGDEPAADANAGENKTVQISNITLGGAAVANYTLATEGQQATTTATITARDITEDATITIAAIASQAYTGQAIEPALTVKYGETLMVAEQDYTVTYNDNINAGTATATITGKGNFTGSKSATYAIYIPIYYYPVSTVDPEHGTLSVDVSEATDGETVSVSATADEGYYVESVTVSVDDYGYTIDATGGSFEMPASSVTITAEIKECQDISGAAVTLDWSSKSYNGETQKATVTEVTLDGSTLTENDYAISYDDENSKDAGEYTITLTATGTTMKGSATATYTITKLDLTVTADDKTMEKGSTVPELTVSYAGFVNGETADVLTTAPKAATEATAQSEVGEYEITVSGGEAKNYALAYVSGKLTVTASQIETEDGQKIEAEVNVDEEGNKSVTITELSEDMLNGSAEIPTTVTTASGETIPVTEIAAEAFENKPEGIIVELPEGMSTTDDVTNVINGDGTVNTLDLTNVEDFNLTREVTADEVIYEVSVEQEKFSVCLPYDMTLPEGVTAFMLANGEDGKATFNLWGSNELKAFMPYVLDVDITAASARRNRAGETVIDLSAKNVTIDPNREDEVMRKDDVEFVGAVHGLTHAEGTEQKALIMQPDFSWKMTASEAEEDAQKQYLPPFHAYLRVTGTSAGTDGNGIESGFDETTGISDVQRTEPEDGNSWYDLNGRKLSQKPTQKGVYIKNGKKVIIK